jgi:hypothetical protein
MPDSGARDTLETMRIQVDAAHATAERLVREAEAAAREQLRDVPPQGWAASPAPEAPGTTVEALQAIAGLLAVVRSAVPPELAHQFAGALRELLVAVRALIDFYLERLDQPPDRAGEPVAVEDIPIA